MTDDAGNERGKRERKREAKLLTEWGSIFFGGVVFYHAGNERGK